ncbi:FecR family protein [Mucilaginibacter paludis]|uniref:Anti-FecI sigma factor, FecR n=1 Tax=Mucilaginibacter paludis DSM 18603 TaxID=714943 RepID=H1Y8W1_9SPHI|nr:FecR domain-containing protein [Mucilaginibacter paludis]EHQ28727.1 anti-FecI sigma factor, FecR [Mucilaginibacter paludis DSM 18603]
MKSIPPELIQKFLNGDCSTEEKEIVMNWYNSFDRKADPYDQLSAGQQQELRLRMLTNIQSGINIAGTAGTGRLKRLKYIGYTIAAAAAILLIFNKSGLLKLAARRQQTGIAQSIDTAISNHTQTICKQVLPDKSVVWLSPGARISYPKKFNGNFREVNLSGESFFEVTKDKAHPFIVYSGHVTTQVWGTSFRIHDIKGESTAEVAVVTGKVSVVIAGQSGNRNGQPEFVGLKSRVMLLPRQKVNYSDMAGGLKVAAVPQVSSLSIWTKASLSFEKKSLNEVIDALNKQFHVEISLLDKGLGDYTVNADFDGQSLPDIMEILKKLLKLTYVTDGTKFVLQKENN